MERLKTITIIFLLAIGLLVPAALAKPPSVLLQEGLYAEEIEGDLDAAIKIYEQVIAEAKEAQRIAAHATYRIGMCYLKKGEQAKAATQFSNLVSKFPDQKTLIAKAQRQLAKLKPPASGFGPVGPVPVEQLIKSGKVPAFKTQIYDNTGLDLETGVTVPLKDEWPALLDVAWDNDGGGALMINPKSSVRFLVLGAAEKWGDAISMARNSLAVLRTSTARGMFASQSKFVAILTSEGNLAVIQIGRYDQEKGTIYWWLEKLPAHSFGPVIERVISSEETGTNFFFDLDTAKAFSPPPGLTRASPEREVIEWSATKGIDFVNDRGRLELAEMTAVKVESGLWDSATPAEIRDTLMKGSPQKILRAHSKDYTISSPITYAFKTREGGIGLLQILEKKDNNLRIRYKMVEDREIVKRRFEFGPVIELTVNDISTESDMLIDFESGKIFTIPKELKIADDFDHLFGAEDREKVRAFFSWIKENGIDALADLNVSVPRLIGFDMAAIPRPRAWNRPADALADKMGGRAVGEIAFISAKPSSTRGWYIKTREGGMGVLQVVEAQTTGTSPHVKVRYKMLLERAKTVAGGWRKVFLPDADTRGTDVVLDLASGELLPAGEGEQQLVGTFAELDKGDLAYDRALICLRGAKAYFIVNDRYGDHLVRLKVLEQRQDVTAYELELGRIPGCYLVSTGEDKDYEINILSADARGIELIYKKATGYELVKRRFESRTNLLHLGLAAIMYAADHNSKLPDTLQELEPYVGKKQDFQWILDNVAYLGKGKTLAGSPGEIVAYDKTMLENGKGTNILYKDAHVQFLRPEGLRKEPGIEGLEKAQIHRRSDERYEPK